MEAGVRVVLGTERGRVGIFPSRVPMPVLCVRLGVGFRTLFQILRVSEKQRPKDRYAPCRSGSFVLKRTPTISPGSQSRFQEHVSG